MQEGSRAEPQKEWQEVRQLWGDKLAPISPDLVKWNISDPTKGFLMDVGLPRKGPLALGVIFYHDERLLGLRSIAGVDYLALGYDYGTILGIKLGTDEVWAVDPDKESLPRFVNSRLSAFVLFLAIYDSRGHDRQHASDEEDEVIVQEMRQQFISRDPHAFDDVENWWSLVFEQMSYGML